MKTLMTVCLTALVTMPAVTYAQTATTETPAKTETMPAPTTTTPADTAPAATTTAPAATTTAPAATTMTPAPTAETTASTAEMPADKVEYVTTEAPGSFYATDLVGQPVYGITDEKTGDINDLLLDDAGNVRAVIIGVGGFVGLGEKDVAVTLESLTIRTNDNDFRISIAATEQELEEAPVYTRADGTTSDRLGALERAYNRTAVEAEKALDEASRRANELYEKGRKAVNDLTETKPESKTAN